MTLNEISSWINRNLRYKLAPDQLVLIIDMVNKLATDQDLDAFKYWDATLTVYTQLNYDTAATAPDANDTLVTGQTSGATGTIQAYDTTNKLIALSGVTGTFTDGEQVTAAEGMDITLDTSDAVEGYKGPYAYPTTVPVRKMIGITTFTDPRLFGTQYVYESDRDDYGLILPWYDERQFYQPARINRLSKTYTFVSAPSIESDADPYRWVYFRGADDITDLDTDDANLIVEDLFHMEFIQACIDIANSITEDGKYDRSTIEKYFWGWWNRLRKNYTPMGKRSNQTNEGNVEAFPSRWMNY